MSTKARHWCFTLNNPEEDDTFDALEGTRYMVYQLEQGESGTPHIQGYVEFREQKRLSALKAWMPRGHFEPRMGTREQARDYCMKEEGRLSEPVEYGDFGSGGQGARTDISAARDMLLAGGTKRQLLDEMPDILAKYPRFVDLVTKMANEDKIPKILEFESKFDWQQSVIDMVTSGEAHDRQILWVFDPYGNNGKTYLAKHLVDKYGAFYCNGGKGVDLCYAYNGESVAIFDYVRDAKEYVNYGVIEQFKNGILFSQKYETGCKRFAVPHVVVMANFAPEEGKFSADRLVVVELQKDGKFELKA